MAKRLVMEAEATRSLPCALDVVWSWNSRLPDALRVFPMLSSYEAADTEGCYRLRLGQIGFGRWTTAIECWLEVNFETNGGHLIRFDSLADRGNTDVEVEMRMTPGPAGGTEIQVKAVISPRIQVPTLAPAALIETTTAATLRVALRRMLHKMEDAIDQELGTAAASRQ